MSFFVPAGTLTRQRLSRIFSFVRRERFGWIALFFIALLLSLASLVQPLIVGLLIDRALLAGNLRLLTLIVLLFVVIAYSAAFLRLVGALLERRIAQRTLFHVRDDLFHHLEHLDLAFFRKQKVGDLLERLDVDSSAIQNLVALIYQFVLSAIGLCVMAAIAFTIDWRITLLALLTIPLYLFVERNFALRLRPLAELVRKVSAELTSFLEERLSAILLIQVFGREEGERLRERGISKKLVRTELQQATVQNTGATVVGLISATLLFGVLWYGGAQVIAGVLTLGSLIALYTYLGGLFRPIETLVGFWSAVQMPLASIDRLFEILETRAETRDRPGAKPLIVRQGRLRFDRIDFSYQPGEPILQKFSLDIAPGTHVGVVGPTGVGKTTLALLLLRFYRPARGRILIDGQDISRVTLRSLRKAVTYLPQEATFFHGTVQENIALGASNARLSDIRAAAVAAGIDDLIMSWPERYRTVVGERGMRLSNGQKQLIALARLFLRRAPIVILDEATSALDAVTETRIREALFRFLKGRTALVIAHRLRTIAEMDRIVVFEGGRVVEDGTFQGLLRKRGRFARYEREQRLLTRER